jgi:hypothetical protein
MSVDVSVMPTLLRVENPAGCVEIQLPAEMRLVPSSCGGLCHVAGDGLHLRLRAHTESQVSPSE